MRRGGLEDDLTICHGWAYEPCERPAYYVMTEIRRDHSWSSHGVCILHAREIIENQPSEHVYPHYRVWQDMQSYRLDGLPEETRWHEREP